jgi:sulfite reductase (NADPH) hemoprotein beta-component
VHSSTWLVVRYGLNTHERMSPVGRDALACVALPTCGLAMAEAERYLPRLIQLVDELLAKNGLVNAPAGCCASRAGPNGCARPYLAEIALVGKAPGRYNLFLGGDGRGERLNVLYLENVDEPTIVAALDAAFARYASERTEGERFGDFAWRAGLVGAKAA